MLTVGSIMTREVVTVPPECTLERVRALAEEHDLRHVPVVERGRLVGLVSDRDLVERGRLRTNGGAPACARDRMTTSIDTVTVDESASRACRRMLERRISCLPVVYLGTVVGILNELDLLRLYERVCRARGHDKRVDPRIETRASAEMIVVAPDATAIEALELCRAKGVRHLPVVHDGWLVGVLSDRDLLPIASRDEGAYHRAGDLMSKDFVAVEPGTPLSAAAECMIANGFHSLPVLAHGDLNGIVTSADVLAALCAIDENVLESAWSADEARTAAKP